MDKAVITNFNQLQNNGGSAVQRLINNGMNINALKPFIGKNGRAYITNKYGKAVPTINATLRKDEWKALDETVVAIAESRLTVANDLRAAGLTRQLGGLGVTLDEYETSSDMTEADIDMAGVTRGNKDDVTFTTHSIPIPIIHKDFSINVRRLEASRKLGSSIDTTQAALAARKVSEKIESLIIDGVSYNIGGNALNGLADTGNSGSITVWSGSGDDPVENVNDMIADAESDGYYGPYNVYVGKTNWAYCRLFYSDGSGQNKRDRIMELSQINDVKVADTLGATEALLVQMTSDVVDLSIGQDITTVEWSTEGGMVMNFKVMAALAPRCKSDDDGNEGVVYYT